MKKLTKKMEEALLEIKEEIEQARSCDTYEEYFMKYQAAGCNNAYNTPEKYKARDLKMWNERKKTWENRKNGVVYWLGHASIIRGLEERGLVTILYDAGADGYSGSDIVKLVEGAGL